MLRNVTKTSTKNYYLKSKLRRPKEETLKRLKVGKIKNRAGRLISQKIESGIKVLTPNKLLTRLPVLLAQTKAGNNSYKLKKEVRQILYNNL